MAWAKGRRVRSSRRTSKGTAPSTIGNGTSSAADRTDRCRTSQTASCPPAPVSARYAIFIQAETAPCFAGETRLGTMPPMALV